MKAQLAPQPYNLKSLDLGGITVEQVCGYLEAPDLRQHLFNPLLNKSLVVKLPDSEMREWVHYRRVRGETTLRTLTHFQSRRCLRSHRHPATHKRVPHPEEVSQWREVDFIATAAHSLIPVRKSRNGPSTAANSRRCGMFIGCC